ncbi:MAG: tetratricopeptide repeat protein [Myxococcales bacterium]|nr:tetratricopeptide repeat protein [Myxococcales bacterium]
MKNTFERSVEGYILSEKVREDVLGEVYLATSRTLNDFWHVTIVHPDLCRPPGGPKLADLFSRLANVKHRALLRTATIPSSATGELYFAEQVKHGATLRALLDVNRKLLWIPAALILHELAEALSVLHKNRLIHGKIVAENVLLEQSGAVILARAGVDEAALRLSGKSAHLTPPTMADDVRSVARLAFEMVYGVAPSADPTVNIERERLVALPAGYTRLVRGGMGADPVAVDELLHEIRLTLRGAGIEDVRGALARYFEDMSFFFLLTKTFVSSDTDNADVSQRFLPPPGQPAQTRYDIGDSDDTIVTEGALIDDLQYAARPRGARTSGNVYSLTTEPAGTTENPPADVSIFEQDHGTDAVPVARIRAHDKLANETEQLTIGDGESGEKSKLNPPRPLFPAEDSASRLSTAPRYRPLPDRSRLSAVRRSASDSASDLPTVRTVWWVALGLTALVAGGWAYVASRPIPKEELARVASRSVGEHVESQLAEVRKQRELAEAEQAQLGVPAVDQRMTSLLAEAEALLDRGEFVSLRAKLTDEIPNHKESRGILRTLIARSFVGEGRYDEAVSELTEAIEQDRQLAGAHELLGEIFVKLGRFDDATDAWSRVLDKHEQDADFLLNLGRAYDKSGNLQAAVGVIQQLVRVRPQDAEGHCLLGKAFEQLRQTKLATTHFETAVRADPTREEALWGLVRTAEKTGTLKNALALVEELRKQNPAMVIADLYLGQLAYQGRKYDKAETHFQEYLRARPGAWEAMMGLGNIYWRSSRYAEARQQYEQVLVLRPTDAKALHNLGMVLDALGERSKAMELFAQSIANNPNQWPSRCELAKQYQRAGRFEEAKIEYVQVHRLSKDHPWARQAATTPLGGALGDFLLTKVCYYPEIFEDLGSDTPQADSERQ